MTEISGVKPSLILHSDLAIVGSSAILKEKKIGVYINTFKEVVRFNRAPTKGWEQYVGSKTTLRVTNNHVFANVKHSVGGDENCEDWKEEGQPQDFIKNCEHQKILLLNKDTSAWKDRERHIHLTSRYFLGDYDAAEKFGGISNPSAGFAFISLCLMNNIRPTLFGFGFHEDDDKASHYWENKDKISSSHGYQLERKQLKLWNTQKKLFGK